MAIGKLLPTCSAATLERSAKTGEFAAGELASWRGLGATRRSVFWMMKGLVNPPLPFAEAELKAGPDAVKHNTVHRWLHTALIALFARHLRALADRSCG